jgi:hypothetical protein
LNDHSWYVSACSIQFTGSSSPVCDKRAERACLTFRNVKYMTDVRHRLAVSADPKDAQLNGEIIAICRSDKAKYLVDLRLAGPLEIECRGLSEIQAPVLSWIAN